MLVNGAWTDRVDAADRGLAYGDGLFETIAVHAGLPCLWPLHMARLAAGASRLRISCPPADLLHRECVEVAAGSRRGVVKLILTRGSGGRGYRPPENPLPTRVLSVHPWPDYPPEWSRDGVQVRFCRTPVGEHPMLAGIKHLNRLEQVLARDEWRDPQVAEGLMCDGHGRVIGGTMTNLFAVAGRRVLTPRIDRSGIAGTVRALVLRLAAAHGLEAAETDLTPRDLAAAEGLFLTNALIGVWPVCRLDEARLDPTRLPWGLLGEVCRRAVDANAKVDC